MNFQYLESFDCEVLPSNLFNQETISSINENNQDEVSSQKQQTHEQETSAEGITLKELPSHLKYEFLEPEKRKPFIISVALTKAEEQKLLVILRKYKEAIALSIEDLKGISPSICMHKILLEDNAKTSVEHQRRLNPVMKEVIRKEVLKWLNAGFIYAISDSSWVSPIHVVPKKGGFTVIRNKKNELIPTRTVTGWRVCIDYRKLNTATKKDHFPFLSLIRCWIGWQDTLIFVFLMDTLDITKLRLHLKIKRKPLLHAHLVLLLLEECHLVCVMLLVPSKDA